MSVNHLCRCHSVWNSLKMRVKASLAAHSTVFCVSFIYKVHLQLIILHLLNIMHSHNVLHLTLMRDLKCTLTDLEFNSELASKCTWLLLDQLSTSSYLTQDEHSEQFSFLCNSLNWQEWLKSSLLRPLDSHYLFTIKQVTVNSQLSAWLDAVLYSCTDFCSASPHTFLSLSCLSWSDHIELKHSQSCEAHFNLIKHKQSVSSLNLKLKHIRLTLMTLQKMSKQESQYVESLVPQFNSSSNKALGTSNAVYIDTLYGHSIIMNLSERKIPQELVPLKEWILQKQSSSQLNDQAVFTVMNTAEKLVYNSEGSTNKILRTLMFSLRYNDLIKGENTQWNTVVMSNNPQCDIKLSALKPDFYLAYSCSSKSS